MSAQSKPLHLTVASSNPGKLREYRALAAFAGASIELALLPNFGALPKFGEVANTFAENAMGKALHYSHFSEGLVIADDSGLVVPALGGAPGVHSARYAGPGASDADRIRKLLDAMRGKKGEERRARFVCVLALAERGEARAVFSASARENCWMPRAERAGLDMIRFFSSLISEKRLRKSRPKKRISTATAGKPFARRSIS